jgi:hypothetical protein
MKETRTTETKENGDKKMDTLSSIIKEITLTKHEHIENAFNVNRKGYDYTYMIKKNKSSWEVIEDGSGIAQGFYNSYRSKRQALKQIIHHHASEISNFKEWMAISEEDTAKSEAEYNAIMNGGK